MTFGDEHERSLPPRQGRLGLIGLLDALRQDGSGQRIGATSLGAALRRTGAMATQRAIIIAVSDFPHIVGPSYPELARDQKKLDKKS